MTRFARHEHAQHADSQIDKINLRIVSEPAGYTDRAVRRGFFDVFYPEYAFKRGIHFEKRTPRRGASGASKRLKPLKTEAFGPLGQRIKRSFGLLFLPIILFGMAARTRQGVNVRLSLPDNFQIFRTKGLKRL